MKAEPHEEDNEEEEIKSSSIDESFVSSILTFLPYSYPRYLE